MKVCLHNRQQLGRRSPVSDVPLQRRPCSASRHSSNAAVVLDLQWRQLRGHRQRGARRGFPGGLSAAGPGTPLVPVCALFAAGLDREQLWVESEDQGNSEVVSGLRCGHEALSAYAGTPAGMSLPRLSEHSKAADVARTIG